MKLAGIVVVVCAAAGCKKSGPAAGKELADATGDVASTVSLAATQLEMLKHDDDPVAFVDAVKTLIELRGIIGDQKRVDASGALGDCAARWYQSTEALAAALDPFIEKAGNAGDESQPISRLFEIKAAWGAAEAEITHALCNLVNDAKVCVEPIHKAGGDTASHLLLANGHVTLCP